MGWTLESLVQVAVAFPAKVAACSKYNWAILTRYDNNKSFLDWAAKSNVTVPEFNKLHMYTKELLHMYMEYKSHDELIQDVIAAPEHYITSQRPDALDVNKLDKLMEARKQIKVMMEHIVEEIDKLCVTPGTVIWRDHTDQ